MLFNSFAFAVYLPLVWIAFWCIARERARQPLLIVASLFFYGWWDWRFVPLMVGLASVAWIAALWSAPDGSAGPNRKTAAISIAGILVPILILGYFKYAEFFLKTASQLCTALGWQLAAPELDIVLPVGISFYTFQSLSYIFDVRRGHCHAERSFWKVLLYIAFFPQLIAGPIVSAKSFLPQLQQERRLSGVQFIDGLRLILWGLMLKVVFGDTLATWANPIFDTPAAYTFAARWSGVLAFYGQIYFDFAGYSTMAVGLGKTFNFELPVNFNLPYGAQSITDFWRRWHISLSTWLREYVFIPLGGNKARLYRNLMITMVIGGLWHGASWNFVLWGFVNGVALCLHKLWAGKSDDSEGGRSLPSIPAWLLTQLFVLVSWVPFRANSLHDTMSFFSNWSGGELSAPACAITWPWLIVPLLIDAVMHRPVWDCAPPAEAVPASRLSSVRLGALIGIALLAILALGTWKSDAFIYFQF